MPAALLSEPESGIIVAHLIEAFMRLSAARGVGMNGSLALSIESIVLVAGMYGYAQPADQSWFLSCMQALDAFYLQQEQVRLKQSSKNKAK